MGKVKEHLGLEGAWSTRHSKSSIGAGHGWEMWLDAPEAAVMCCGMPCSAFRLGKRGSAGRMDEITSPRNLLELLPAVKAT